MLAIHLRDISSSVAAAWETTFAGVANVEVSCGNIFECNADAIVSPANSFGRMDGGIDLVFSNFFGWDLEANLKVLLMEQYYGELPVGQAVILPTGNKAIPLLVSAPTMRVPSNISKTINVYLAFRAALLAVVQHNKTASAPIQSLLVPGLGTGIGEVSPERAALQMHMAYNAIIGGTGLKKKSARDIWIDHEKLISGN